MGWIRTLMAMVGKISKINSPMIHLNILILTVMVLVTMLILMMITTDGRTRMNFFAAQEQTQKIQFQRRMMKTGTISVTQWMMTVTMMATRMPLKNPTGPIHTIAKNTHKIWMVTSYQTKQIWIEMEMAGLMKMN